MRSRVTVGHGPYALEAFGHCCAVDRGGPRARLRELVHHRQQPVRPGKCGMRGPPDAEVAGMDERSTGKFRKFAIDEGTACNAGLTEREVRREGGGGTLTSWRRKIKGKKRGKKRRKSVTQHYYFPPNLPDTIFLAFTLHPTTPPKPYTRK